MRQNDAIPELFSPSGPGGTKLPVTKYLPQPPIVTPSFGVTELATATGDSPVLLEGSITIAGMADAHQALLAAMATDGSLTIDIGGVSEADLTFVQLIEAARRSAAKAGRSIALTAPATGPVHEVLRRGGFLDPADTDRINFWLQEPVQP
jgi:anti-anti-sigma regulatory factor